jgi:hypothetical protein
MLRCLKQLHLCLFICLSLIVLSASEVSAKYPTSEKLGDGSICVETFELIPDGIEINRRVVVGTDAKLRGWSTTKCYPDGHYSSSVSIRQANQVETHDMTYPGKDVLDVCTREYFDGTKKVLTILSDTTTVKEFDKDGNLTSEHPASEDDMTESIKLNEQLLKDSLNSPIPAKSENHAGTDSGGSKPAGSL